SALGAYKVTQDSSPEVELDHSNSVGDEREERQWQREQAEIAWQREREKREWERKERQFKLKQQEIELQKLQLESQNKSSDHSTPYFDVTKHIRMVPPFQEREVDKYFLHFEKVAKNCNWPKESWTMLLQSVLLGKAREIFSQLTVEDSGEYDTVKRLILKGYELVPEAYRQKFHILGKSSNKTFVEFAQEKAQLFDRWCTSENVENKYDRLRELILIEEFTNCLSNDVRTFVTDKKPETLSDAACLADNFLLTHKFSTTGIKSNMFPSRGNSLAFDNKCLPPPRQFQGRYPGNDFSSFNNKPRNGPPESWRRPSPFKSIVCDYCKRSGHTRSECHSLKFNRPPPKPTRFISSSNTKPEFHSLYERQQQPKQHVVESKQYIHKGQYIDPSMDTFKPFIFDGSVSLSNDQSNVYLPIKILRDTGASQSLILTRTLPFSTNSYSGKNVLICGVNSKDYRSMVTGDVSLGVIESLPFDGIHLLLGNDLAGDKVTVNPILTNKPCLSQQPDPVEQVIPDLYPSCAVTTAIKKRQDHEIDNVRADEIDMSDTFLSKVSENLDANDNQSSFSKSSPIREQQNDPEISALYQKSSDEMDATGGPVCYFIKNGVLMRKWRPLYVSADNE
ncbi:Transposon Ty3-I Gag-Pol poly, partial [Paramuricea clavata]